jgi:hypothetical protein
MKKLLGIIIINLIWFNNTYSEELSTKLFNIKLYDKIYDYASKEQRADQIFDKQHYSYVDTKKKPIRKLTKNSNFDSYIITTNLDYEILEITGFDNYEIYVEYFEDECQVKQEKLKDSLIKFYQLKRNSFKKKFYKSGGSYQTTLHRTYQYEYYKNFKKIILNLECSYQLRGDTKKYVSVLFRLDLADKKYFNDTNKLTKIRPFDKEFILSDLSGF